MVKHSTISVLAVFCWSGVVAILVVFGFGKLHGQSTALAGSEIQLEWEAVDDASRYEIKLVPILASGKKKKPLLFKAGTPSWKGRISAGHYKMQLRSYDDRDVPGEWSESADVWVKLDTPKLTHPKNGGKITAKVRVENKVLFKWRKVTEAAKYFVEVESKEGYSEVFESKTNSIEIPLTAGKDYSWKVTAVTVDAHKGNEMKSPFRFVLFSPQLRSPKIKEFHTLFPQKLEWKGGRGTKEFTYALHRKTRKGWKRLATKKNFKGESISFSLAQPTGEYRLMVRGHAPLAKSSQLSKFIFNIEGGLRGPAAIKKAKLRENLGRQNSFYGLASYLITQITYTGENLDTNKSGSFDAVGGTGRLGIGYRKQGSPWSYLGIADLGGFKIEADNHTFSSIELHGSWSRFVGGSDLMEVGGGFYTKEMVEVADSSASGVASSATANTATVNKISILGSHFGASYRKPFNRKIGMKVKARVYFPLSGEGSNGSPLEQDISYTFGLLGSYNLSHNAIGYAGYAYRLDTISYESSLSVAGDSEVTKGALNSIEITGHFFNLILEYDF